MQVTGIRSSLSDSTAGALRGVVPYGNEAQSITA